MQEESSEKQARLNAAIDQHGRVLYSKYLGKALSEKCQDMAEATCQLSLIEELQLARVMVCNALEAYENAIEAAVKADVTGVKLDRIKQAAGSVVMSAIHDVKEIAIAHRKVVSEASLDTLAVQSIVLQLVQIVDGKVQEIAPVLRQANMDPMDFSRSIADGIQSQVRLPKSLEATEHGPEMSTDEAAMLMDATVPAAPADFHLINSQGLNGHNGNGHN